MAAKSEQLQIRVSRVQKTALRRYARKAGMDVSAYVLMRALPSSRERLEAVLSSLRNDESDRYVLAELHDLLQSFTRAEFVEAVSDLEVGGLDSFLENYVAAMVELAASRRGVVPPAWVRDIGPLKHPYFEGGLRSLRPHLLRVSPVAFRKRNIFIDATLGDRV